MSTTASVPTTGDVLGGKYILRECLGKGGMGVVFRAELPEVDRHRSVAIKILSPQSAAGGPSVRQLADEVIAANRVKHPGAVSVIDCDLLGDAPFLVMEHVQGRPLGRLVAEGMLPVTRALAIIDQILDVLEAAHAAGVVHADVKSDNVLVERRGDRDVVTLIDFGLARVDGAWLPSEEVFGTPGYMAPELVRGAPPTVASDLYGAAVVLYEMLTGVPPFVGKSSMEIFIGHLREQVPPPSMQRRTGELSAALDEIVLRALAKDPRARFASARELQLALRSVAASVIRRAAMRAAMREVNQRSWCFRCGAEPARADRCGRCHAIFQAKPVPVPVPRADLAYGSDVRPPASPGSEPSRPAAETSGPPGGTSGPRAALARALVAGDVAAIAGGYVALAEALAREQRPADALRELEEGLDVLTAGDADHAREAQRLVTALATLSKRWFQGTRWASPARR